MPIHEYTPGIKIPQPYEPLNPVPIDSWSGPYAHPDGTTAGGITLALTTIPPALRFLSMEVRILARPGGVTQAYKYWFRGSTGTLEEFASGGGGVVGSDFPTGISANGATFNGLVRAYAGISVNGSATFGAVSATTITATTFSGNATNALNLAGVSGASYARIDIANTFLGLNSFNAGISAPGATFSGTVVATTFSGNATNALNISGVSGASYARLDIANTFIGLQNFNNGVTFAGTSTVVGVLGGVTYTLSVIPQGTSLGQGISFTSLGNAAFNGNVLIGPSGGQIVGGTTQGVVIVRSGTTFEKDVNFSGAVRAGTFTGALSGNATTATTAFNAINLAGVCGTTYARLDSANTFGSLQTFNSGITTSSVYSTTLTTQGNANIGGTLTVDGNFFVQGTLTTVNRVDLEIDDAFIVLGRTLDTDALLDNAGIWLGVSGSSQNATSRYLRWQNSELAWQSSNNFNVPSGGAYEVSGANVLAANQVHGLSFSSSATISAGTWQGGVIGLAYGGTNKNLSAVGVSGGIVFKDGSGFGILGTTGSASQVLIGSANGTPAWANLTALTGLTADRVSVQDSSSTAGTFFLTFVDATSGAVQIRADTGITYSATGNILSCTQIEAIIDGGVWT